MLYMVAPHAPVMLLRCVALFSKKKSSRSTRGNNSKQASKQLQTEGEKTGNIADYGIMRTPLPFTLSLTPLFHLVRSRRRHRRLRQHAGEPAKVVNRRLRGERVHPAQTAASAALALAICALSRNDSRDGARSGTGAGARGCCGVACEDGDGRRDGGGGRVDVLDGRFGEACAVLADGEVLEVGHCLVAGGGRVDAEDHALAAVDAVLLLAVEPCGTC
jgi:hypothetical protein